MSIQNSPWIFRRWNMESVVGYKIGYWANNLSYDLERERGWYLGSSACTESPPPGAARFLQTCSISKQRRSACSSLVLVLHDNAPRGRSRVIIVFGVIASRARYLRAGARRFGTVKIKDPKMVDLDRLSTDELSPIETDRKLILTVIHRLISHKMNYHNTYE